MVLNAGAVRFLPVATYGVAESETWAHLAVGTGVVLVKDVRSLTSWRTR
jgi:hypothetical protein